MALIEIDDLPGFTVPFLKMVDLSMAMLNNQMVSVEFKPSTCGNMRGIYHGKIIGIIMGMRLFQLQ